MPDKIESVPTSIDPKLEVTDARGLDDLNKAFDDAFGPVEKTPGTPQAEPEAPATPAPAKPADRASGKPLAPARATPGHHAPVEVKPLEKDGAADKGLNLLDAPEPKARARAPKKEEIEGASVAPPKEAPGKEEGEEAAPEEEKEEEADPEVDAISAKQNAHPQVKEGIQRLKTIAKARLAEARALTKRNQTLAIEVEALKKNGVPPDIQSELTRLRATSQRFDLLNDVSFKSKYDDPIEAQGDRLCQFMVAQSGNDPRMVEWAKQTKAFGYKNISRDFWDQEILPNIVSDIDRSRVAKMAGELTELSDARNRIVTDFVANPDKIAEYQQARALENWSAYQKEAESEVQAVMDQVGDWAKIKDVNAAKSDEERELFGEHNARVEGYKTLFEKTMGDLINGGARKHVRIATQAIYAMEMHRLYQERAAAFDELEARHQTLLRQYEKVTKARSIPGRTGGAVEIKQPSGVSTKDARTAFKEYFGSQGS